MRVNPPSTCVDKIDLNEEIEDASQVLKDIPLKRLVAQIPFNEWNLDEIFDAD